MKNLRALYYRMHYNSIIIGPKVQPCDRRGKMEESKCCGCPYGCCSGEDAAVKAICVEYLYLDLEDCGRCSDTFLALGEAIREARMVFEGSGITISIAPVKVESQQQAIELRFSASPTIRMNGRDICEAVTETRCEQCCSQCGSDVTCRVWRLRGQTYDSAPKALIIDALIRAAYSPQPAAGADEEFTLPENLRKFFAGRR